MRVYEIFRRIVIRTLVAMLTFAPGMSAAQQESSPSGKSQPARDAAKKLQSASHDVTSPAGPHEGIKIHGHWSIVIKNPNGSVASRHEFENALASTGPDFLGQFLARAATQGVWEINLLNSQAGGSACGGVGCTLIEPVFTTAGGSNNLAVSFATNPSRTVLQGSFQATSAGDIIQVNTSSTACQPSISPSACPGSLGGAGLAGAQIFSSRSLTSPITVQAGQIVQVTVTFTFS